MSKSVNYEQDYEAQLMASGQVLYHRAGIEIRVMWKPGQSESTREEFRRAVETVIASIRDEEGDHE